jgi:hypothetical protein
MSRAWSLALPVVTLCVVLYALLVAGVPRKIAGARVYGGPTEGASVLALRVEIVQRDGEQESPYWDGSLRATARPRDAAPVVRSVTHGLNGVCDFALEFSRALSGPVQLELRDAEGGLLADGDMALDREHWAARAHRRGGWIRGREIDSLVVSIAPERGAFVIDAADPLLIRVERAGSALPGARLVVSADGAELSAAQDLRTDARGRARLDFKAVELNPTLRVEAHTDDGHDGLIESGVPVVPGGLHGVATATGIRVESATPRTETYFSIVTDLGRISGGALALTADGHGGSFAVANLPPLPHPAWLVVSSDVDQNSAATIGWPLDVGSEPARTFDVPDALLLDGLPQAFAREQARRSRVRWLTATFIAGAFALSVLQLVLRVRAADRDIVRHLRASLEIASASRVAPRALLPLLAAVLTIGLGFIALGLVVLARAH